MKESKIISFKGMPLFQKATFESPFSMHGELEDIACFFYILEGTMISYDKRGSHHTHKNNAILKNCGRYIQRFVSENHDKDCEAIAVFLYPKLLKVPSFFLTSWYSLKK